MKSRGPILLLLFAFLAVHRSPAPILEESPTPKPKAVAKKKTDDEGKGKSQTQTKSKESPFAQFAGVWTGSTSGRLIFDNGLDTGASTSTTTLTISSDGTIQGAQYRLKGSVSSDGHALIWPIQYSDSNATVRGQASLRLTGPKTGLYKSDIIMTLNVGGRGVMDGSGTLTKQ
jgi:hypothetical protein